MRITIDFNNVMSERVGPEGGIRPEEIDGLRERAKSIHNRLTEGREKGEIGFYNLPYDLTTLRDIKRLSKEIRDDFDTFVLFGIGGSCLGPKAIFTALRHPYHNLLSKPAPECLNQGKGRRFPRVFFFDNIDPDGFQGLLDVIDIKRTVFNVISKSGETPETVSQFMIIKRLLERGVGKEANKHLIITTDPKRGCLRRIADEEGIKCLQIPPNVGGRYSALSSVGLLPSAVAGIDIEELLSGARFMDDLTKTDVLWKNPAYISAVIQYLAYQRGKRILVFMPYSSALSEIADWFIQLWAESLGKERSLKGEVVNMGPTPIKAIGTTDQHAQLQLFMEGPYDKLITFLTVGRFHSKIPIPEVYQDIEGMAYLGGHTMEGLYQAERVAVEIALTKKGRINYTIHLPEINPFTIGQLLFFFEVQTAFAGGLFDVNPFDQPGVEEGKRLVYGILGKRGYEDRGREVKAWSKRDKGYVI